MRSFSLPTGASTTSSMTTVTFPSTTLHARGSLEVCVDRILAYASDHDTPEYDRMVDALKTVRAAHTGEPVVFSLCEWGWVCFTPL